MAATFAVERMAGNAGIYRIRKNGVDTGKRKLVYRVGGRQYTKTFEPPNALEQAREWRSEQVTSKVRGMQRDPRRSRITVQELYEEFHAVRGPDYASATVSLHAEIWKRVGPREADGSLRRGSLATMRLSAIDKATVQRFLATIERPAMREKTRLLLSALFNHAIEHGRVAFNAAQRPRQATMRSQRKGQAGGSRVDRSRILSNAQLALLASEMPERYGALIRFMARTGLRPGEVLALRVGAYEPLTRRLTVEMAVSGDTKTGEAREFVLPKAVGEWLVEHLARFGDPSDSTALVFGGRDGEMLTLSGFRTIFKRAAKRASLPPHLNPNDLRHTAAAYAIEHGANVYHVQRMLGHSKPSVTLDIYGELWDGSMNKLADTLDEAISADSARAAVSGEVVDLPSQKRGI